MPDDIVSRVLDIDTRADDLIAGARAEAEAVHRETVAKTDAAKARLDERVARGVAEAEAREREIRKAKLAEVDKEFAERESAVRSVSEDALAHAVRMVVDRARGASS